MRQDSPEDIVLFVDRCLGRIEVATALRAAGARVETHDAHFPITCDDDEWLPKVGALGWIVLTKDKYIRRRPKERRALEDVLATVARSGAITVVLGERRGAVRK